MKRYTFVDYATQGYSALVALLILLFHNGTVPHWIGLLGFHVAGLAIVHLLIQAQPRGWTGPLLDFLRHFYPVLLYAGFFARPSVLRRTVRPEYYKPSGELNFWEFLLWCNGSDQCLYPDDSAPVFVTITAGYFFSLATILISVMPLVGINRET